ncbi:MAG TPA: hypothetical protein EYN38_07025 [Flavobacteriales bacterium]|nr:hypothetical protein [Flavobacteriales bacterium]
MGTETPWIGRRMWMEGDESFDGYIDEMSVWNRAFSGLEPSTMHKRLLSL